MGLKYLTVLSLILKQFEKGTVKEKCLIYYCELKQNLFKTNLVKLIS